MFKMALGGLLFVFLLASNVQGQDEYFWSFADLNGGAVSGDVHGQFNVGETGTLFLYYSTFMNDLETGAFLDISLTNSGVLEFTAAETFEYDILYNGIDIADRWGDGFGPGSIEPDGQLAEVYAFSVTGGTGILAEHGPESTGILDAGYDAGAEAFLFARVDFNVVDLGETNLNIVSGACGILTEGFGNCEIIASDATITVVPEPGFATVFGAFAVCCCLSNRRRKRENQSAETT